MDYSYDLHIHSCLSPCADNDMTPNNIVNMAKLCGLDIIALTDHNSALNCQAAVSAGLRAGITVIPGMELCTSEEAHVVCLFPSVQSALDFSELVRSGIPQVKNRPEIFGEQLILNEKDEIIGSEELLLTTASNISINQVVDIVSEYGGFCFPAHIDRNSYSVISNLGMISPDMGFSAAELADKSKLDEFKDSCAIIEEMKILTNSDAHALDKLGLSLETTNLESPSFNELTSFLRKR